MSIGVSPSWQAEDDANCLAQAEAIKSDPARLKAAQAKAEELLKDTKERMDGLGRVAKAGHPASTTTKKVGAARGFARAVDPSVLG